MNGRLSVSKQIAHIGIAVRSIGEVLPFYKEVLGLQVVRQEIMEEEGVLVAFLPIGECFLELMEPLDEHSPVFNYIEKHGGGIHHVAIEVDQLHHHIKIWERSNVPLLNNYPKKGAWGKRVAFIHPVAAHGVLFEFCERQANRNGHV
ncbi:MULTISPECIES: methylmalonyl-CoA epimerase [Clostridia]|uniref:methylmalonyl-CoA epimerase n=1 Tax=Clostridia TaxID=186801 RepID=UPI000EA3FBE7|nr:MULTISPECIES: methylmalonyl-CoA epimerase [Clostridia]NBJ70220.1 methylmalonyl-CoA epimerase [Roseburia sp. 1XD42-34]RKI76960.1 methylmalonyl-CoA epimerase [Clostridium sp. 1xD42-85]